MDVGYKLQTQQLLGIGSKTGGGSYGTCDTDSAAPGALADDTGWAHESDRAVRIEFVGIKEEMRLDCLGGGQTRADAVGAQAVLDRTDFLGRDAYGIEQARGFAGGPVAMVVDLADAFAWAAEIVAPHTPVRSS